MKYTTSAIKVLSAALILGSISMAHANGTVKCPTPKPHRHHVPKCHKPAMHEACAAPVSCFVPGFYVGLQSGYSLMHGKYNNDYFDDVSLNSLKKSLWNSGIVGEALIGGRYVWDNHVITGLEVGVLVDSNRLRHDFVHPISIQEEVSTFNSQLRRQYAFTPAFVLGYEFCQRWHAFLKLGASISTFKLREQNLEAATTFRTKKRKTTFMPGIGLEYAMNCWVSFQGTLTYERFSKIHKKFQPIVEGFPGPYYSVRAKSPQYSTFKLGMLVKL